MYTVYILYSPSTDKTYVGYTSEIERRIFEHNNSDNVSYTKNYRPWLLVHTEVYATKTEAIRREKFYKSGIGREKKKAILEAYKMARG